MSTLQSKIEDLLQKSVGTKIKKLTPLGFPKLADAFISSITIIESNDSNFKKGIEIDLSWAGSGSLLGVPNVSLKNNPIKATVSRASGGGLLLISKDLHYNKAPIEVTLVDNLYKIKGSSNSYTL